MEQVVKILIHHYNFDIIECHPDALRLRVHLALVFVTWAIRHRWVHTQVYGRSVELICYPLTTLRSPGSTVVTHNARRAG